MSDIAIKFENISKQYRLGLVSTKTLSHDLNRWWQTTVLRKEDPYLKIGETNDRSRKGSSEYVWALRDIDFEVKQGDVLGIIGKNGAGKSTLLKILSRVTTPTTGTIKAKGRIASLLEVGTGFHPELTGRENIYMNGSIMGMTKAEITRKLDEIVDFAGVARYIDTPVKRYSSGMTVRLGFSIAAHLEPEILVVDEVLAVGDADFQKKAIGKMQDVSKGEGRTVLFVSHNMAAVRSLCQTGIIFQNGTVAYLGAIDACVDEYLRTRKVETLPLVNITNEHRRFKTSKEVEFLSIRFMDDKNEFNSSDELIIEFSLKCTIPVKEFRIAGSIWTMGQNRVGTFFSETFSSLEVGTKSVIIKIGPLNLSPESYYLNFSIGIGSFQDTSHRDFDYIEEAQMFRITDFDQNTKKSFVGWSKNWGNILFPVSIVD